MFLNDKQQVQAVYNQKLYLSNLKVLFFKRLISCLGLTLKTK